MLKLGEKNYTLLSLGAKSFGNWTEGYYLYEENMYCHEGKTIFAFCEWLDANDIAMGSGNYEDRFTEFITQTQ